ncbi:MAG: hypothetical protein FVQ76_11530 [Nitrospira sp.]|jgi:hypothetical protein|nr:hypothetical protein [Nitrospira sp.]
MYARAIITLAAAVMLTACYESADVTVHKPGVYKGAKDPLLAKQRMPEQQQALRERFALVQPDR